MLSACLHVQVAPYCKSNNSRTSQQAPILLDEGKGRTEKSKQCKKNLPKQQRRYPETAPRTESFLSRAHSFPSLARCLNPQPRSRTKLRFSLVKVSFSRSPSVFLAYSLFRGLHAYTQCERARERDCCRLHLWRGASDVSIDVSSRK